MIKIVRATYIDGYQVDLYFSNSKKGRYDFSEAVSRSTELTQPLADVEYFKQFFLELGALCWKNGLEFSPSSLYKKLEQANALENVGRAA